MAHPLRAKGARAASKADAVKAAVVSAGRSDKKSAVTQSPKKATRATPLKKPASKQPAKKPATSVKASKRRPKGPDTKKRGARRAYHAAFKQAARQGEILEECYRQAREAHRTEAAQWDMQALKARRHLSVFWSQSRLRGMECKWQRARLCCSGVIPHPVAIADKLLRVPVLREERPGGLLAVYLLTC